MSQDETTDKKSEPTGGTRAPLEPLPVPNDCIPELDEDEKQVCLDLIWASQDPELQERYPDKLVAVYRRKVVAVADDWQTVWEEAERVTGLPRNKIAVVSVLGPSIFSSPLSEPW